jgi:hypothetical protein
MCVLPPLPQARKVVVTFDGSAEPKLSFVPKSHQPPKTNPQGGDAATPEHFTCSDCVARAGDIDLMRQRIPREFQFAGTVSPGSTTQTVSPDGRKIYYQRGPQGKLTTPQPNRQTTLYEIDIDSGKERALTTHEGDAEIIDELRPSPDGRKLAYQAKTGGGFTSVPEVYVLDLATLKVEQIALGSGPMHWSSTSDKLYFYRRWLEGKHDDCLWVAEFTTKTAPKATLPASKPTTLPAQSQP